ncbi:MAG TPA: hypothetical protein VK776_07550 [Bryobacteraceae bacterium]|jgi:hypothetical protein|nr:hypothetical protein [Bryobacteraceae bacterium]
MLRFLRASSLAVLLAAFESACAKKHAAAPVPATPPAAPAETAPQPAPPATAPPQVQAPPATQPQAPPPSPSPQQPSPQQPSPPQQTPSLPQQTPPASTPPARSPRPAEPNRSGQPNAAPRLGDILTAEQERQYNSAVDQSLARTQTSLAAIANRKLTKEQEAVVAQIKSFVQQAQTTRKSNLPAARSLAERADVLARDLAGSLR